MLQPKSSLKKFTRKATNEEASRFKGEGEGTPKIVSKLTRVEKFVPNEKAPEKMKTKSASPVPTKDLPSKLNAAVQKAKEYKSFDNMPRMKMKQTKSYKG
jgi:hypothetical protein